ncbi:hypothetical protein [Desmonostoc muscorum]|uniref:hypothetical protein n=1 Tax=Desmonostoc muscorum TaxID=1179 RepID=UPI001F1794A4|nr:hypothetical protein [Desmonostoc muscorum]
MINIRLTEDKEIDVVNVKCTFIKINITNLVHLTGDELDILTMLGGNHTQPLEDMPNDTCVS